MIERTKLGFNLDSTLEQDVFKTPPKNPVLEAFKKNDQINFEKDSQIINLKNEVEEIKEKMFKDSLTDCYNRNFYENFKKENFDPNRDHDKLGLIFIDLNNLKNINDTKGHHFGDELIKETGNFLKTNCRKEDMIFRYGGDEFIIVCRNHNNIPDFEENLYTRIEEIRVKNSPVDFAFGVAVFNKSIDSSLNNTQHRADKAMYEYKQKIKSVK